MARVSSSDFGLSSLCDCLSPCPSSGSVLTKFSSRRKSNHHSLDTADRAGLTDDISWLPSGSNTRCVFQSE